MPDLPLHHFEPFAATLGVMLYPGTSEAERAKASAFTSQYLAAPLREYLAAGGAVQVPDLHLQATTSGCVLDDLQKRWRQGQAVGELLKAVLALACHDPKLASWNNAVHIVETHASQKHARAGRSFLWEAKREFVTVAHLWASWSFRAALAAEQQWQAGSFDFEGFVCEADEMRDWGCSFVAARDKAAPLLPADCWRLPANWRPQNPVNTPQYGRLPELVLPANLLELAERSNRPRAA